MTVSDEEFAKLVAAMKSQAELIQHSIKTLGQHQVLLSSTVQAVAQMEARVQALEGAAGRSTH